MTLRDVAERANVSTAVVSYVVNEGPRPTSIDVRDRVLKAIAELNYHPNGVARGLRARRTQTIGFIANDYHPFETFNSHYLASILSALAAELKARGRYLLIYPLTIGEDLTPLEHLLRSGRLDGVVVRMVQDPPATDPLLELIAGTELPCVCIERPGDPRFGFTSVTYDDAGGASAATNHLLAAGHRRIAHLQGDPRYATAQARRDGYQEALSRSGVAVDNVLIRVANWNMSEAAAAMRDLLTITDPPTAVFAASDDMALGALEALRARGVRVPEEMAIVGFDGIPLAREVTPALTTIRLPLAEIGRRAATFVLRDATAGATATRDMLPVELVRAMSA